MLAGEHEGSAAQILWVTECDAAEWALVTEITLDSEGNCYVAGIISEGSLGQGILLDKALLVAKCDIDGDLLWEDRTLASSAIMPGGMAADDDGYLCVIAYAGETYRENGMMTADLSYLRRYGPNGWSAWWTMNLPDFAMPDAIEHSDDGGVVITGRALPEDWVRTQDPHAMDFFVAVYGANGGQLSVTRFPAEDYNSMGAFLPYAFVGEENIVIAGYLQGNAEDAKEENDVIVLNYDSEGHRLAAIQFGTPEDDVARAVATDAEGNCFVVGQTHGVFGDDSGSVESFDFFVAKFARDGTQQWIVQDGEPGPDKACGLTVDTEGNVYVTGHMGFYYADLVPNTSSDEAAGPAENGVFVIKYDTTGCPLWKLVFGPGRENDDTGLVIAVGPDGTCYVGGALRRPSTNDDPADGKGFIMAFTPPADETSDDVPRDGRDDASADDAPADDPPGNSSAE